MYRISLPFPYLQKKLYCSFAVISLRISWGIFVQETRTEHTLRVKTQPRSLVGGSSNGSIRGSTVHAGCWYAGKKAPKHTKPFCIWLALFSVLGSVIAPRRFYRTRELASL